MSNDSIPDPDSDQDPDPLPNPAAAQQSSNSQEREKAHATAMGNARNELRKHLSSARRQLSNAQVIDYSSAICKSLLPFIEPCAHIAGYLALGNEVRVDAVFNMARQKMCKTYVPIVQAEHQMVFAPIDDDVALVRNKFGILEPELAATESIPAGCLDVVLVPLVGFDEHCQRMGMGGGFYDRAFAVNKDSPDCTKKPLLIGVAYNIQQTASVLPDWWDVPLDIIVTETQVIRRAEAC
jgi:5-formyltetrahydrofolate cyclo-ligase